jgi:hypothetical protein
VLKLKVRPGTGFVFVFKIFCRKKAKILSILTQLFRQENYLNIGFKENRYLSHKIAQIAQNGAHNVDPWQQILSTGDSSNTVPTKT